MERVKSQLREYHKSRGLTGSELGTAVWQDLCRFKRNVKAYMKQYNIPKKYYGDHIYSEISSGFLWDESPEGTDYWFSRHM